LNFSDSCGVKHSTITTFGEAGLFNFDDIDSNQSVFVVVAIGWMVVYSERMQIQ
jgi:hypothetical protein